MLQEGKRLSPGVSGAVCKCWKEDKRLAACRLDGHAQLLEDSCAPMRHIVEVDQQCHAALESVMLHHVRREGILQAKCPTLRVINGAFSQ